MPRLPSQTPSQVSEADVDQQPLKTRPSPLSRLKQARTFHQSLFDMADILTMEKWGAQVALQWQDCAFAERLQSKSSHPDVCCSSAARSTNEHLQWIVWRKQPYLLRNSMASHTSTGCFTRSQRTKDARHLLRSSTLAAHGQTASKLKVIAPLHRTRTINRYLHITYTSL